MKDSQNERAPIQLVDAENTEQIGRDDATETTALFGVNAEREGYNGNNDANKPSPEDDNEFPDVPQWRRPNVYWLVGPYCLFTLAFGGIIVPKIDLIVTLICRRYYAEQQLLDPNAIFSPVTIGGNNPQCNSAPVQKRVATFTLVLSALIGGLSAFTAPKLGALSDRYGRKRLLVVASCGGVLNEIVTIFTAKYPDMIDYRFLIVGGFFDGITGSFTAGSVLGNSYASDCTPPSKRGVAIGYLQACLFAGLAFGPYISGKFVQLTGSLLSIFYIALGCHIFVIIFFWFFLPESLSKKRQMLARDKHDAQKETTEAALSPSVTRYAGSRIPTWLMSDRIAAWLPILLSANPFAPLKMFVPSGQQNSRLRRNMLLLAFIDTVLMSGAMGAGTVLILYGKFMFNWGTLEASKFISIVSLFRVLALLGVFPIVNYLFRIRPMRRRQQQNGNLHMLETHSGADDLDVWTVRLAIMSDFLGVMGYVFVRTEELFVLSGVFTAFGGLASATIQSSMTKQIPIERTGAMLGAMGLLHALARVCAPIVFDGIYAGTIDVFPQTFVVVLASLFGLSVVASLFIRPHLFLKEEGYSAVPVREPGAQEDLENLIVEEQPSETLPRI